MPGKQVTELDALPSFTDTSLLPVHNGAGLKKGLLSQLVSYLGNKFSNPNLLTNPDFKINQRGNSTYTTSSESSIYTVDRWMLARGKATVNSDGTVTVTATGGTMNKEGYFQQKLDNAISGAYTVSMEVVRISGTVKIAIDGAWKTVTSGKNVFQGVNSSNNFNSVGLQLAVGASITLKYMKLEQGAVATAYTAPNLIEEYPKCQRYFQYIPKLYCVPLMYTRNMINSSDKYFQSTNGNLPTEMRIKPTLKYKASGQSDGSTFADNASFELDSKSINTVTLSSVVSNFSITVNEITLDAEIY